MRGQKYTPSSSETSQPFSSSATGRPSPEHRASSHAHGMYTPSAASSGLSATSDAAASSGVAGNPRSTSSESPSESRNSASAYAWPPPGIDAFNADQSASNA